MGFISDIFGGREGTAGQVIDVTPDEFTALRDPISKALSGAITGTNPLNLAGIPQGPQPNVAPLGETEGDILNRITQSLLGPNALSGASRDILQKTLAGDFLRPGSNPFLGATITAAQRPVTEAFKELVLPQLRSTFTRAGQTIQGEGSSPFAKALVQAGRDLTRNLGDIGTRIAGQNFQTERARQQAAVGQAAQFSQGELQNLVTGLQTSALPRLIEQRGIEEGTREFQNRMNLLLQILSLATGAASPTTAVIQPTPGTAGVDIGGLLSGGVDIFRAINAPSTSSSNPLASAVQLASLAFLA